MIARSSSAGFIADISSVAASTTPTSTLSISGALRRVRWSTARLVRVGRRPDGATGQRRETDEHQESGQSIHCSFPLHADPQSFDAGVMVPNRPSLSSLGPAVK